MDFHRMSKTDEPSITYATKDHLAVLCQMYGSIWRQVLPFCVVNVAIAVMVGRADAENMFDLSFSDKGHTFLSIMVSYLAVTRLQVAYKSYMEARQLLTDMMRSCRELVQHTSCFSRCETSRKAQSWRSDIARRTCSMLRTAVNVMEYDVKGQHVWQVPELSRSEKQALVLSVGGANERSPLVLCLFLRTAIASHVELLSTPLDVNEELALLNSTVEFISAYHGVMKLMTTPYPFPLVQMTRTIVFVWVYTLSFALNSDIQNVPALVFVVFFVTYGFVGLELVSMELDHPFGERPNAFDALALAQVVFDDIFVVIQDVDGDAAARALKKQVQRPLKDQIRSAVKKHQRFTRMDSWACSQKSSMSQRSLQRSLFDVRRDDGGINDDIFRGTTEASVQHAASQDENSAIEAEAASLAAPSAESGSPTPPTPKITRSILLQSIEGKGSDSSIDVFGVDETVHLDLKSGSFRVSSRGNSSLRSSGAIGTISGEMNASVAGATEELGAIRGVIREVRTVAPPEDEADDNDNEDADSALLQPPPRHHRRRSTLSGFIVETTNSTEFVPVDEDEDEEDILAQILSAASSSRLDSPHRNSPLLGPSASPRSWRPGDSSANLGGASAGRPPLLHRKSLSLQDSFGLAAIHETSLLAGEEVDLRPGDQSLRPPPPPPPPPQSHHYDNDDDFVDDYSSESDEEHDPPSRHTVG